MAYNISRTFFIARDRIAAAVKAGEFGADWVVPAWKSMSAAERKVFRGRRDFEFSVAQKIRCS